MIPLHEGKKKRLYLSALLKETPACEVHVESPIQHGQYKTLLAQRAHVQHQGHSAHQEGHFAAECN